MIDFSKPQAHLNGMTAAEFLRDYWHKKPLLIRNAFPQVREDVKAGTGIFSITGNELAGLALEAEVHSRLITGAHPENHWQVEHGPFSAERFASLPKSNWSLLISDLEKHLPEFLELVEYFRFIPDWRIDDLMVSYAPAGGSVGRHTDDYDVFLLQGHGVRRWQIESTVQNGKLIEGLDLKILQEFHPDQDWELAAGDMLYLPPKLAHYGVAQSDCMTFSIGFRAPAWQDLSRDYCDELCEHIGKERYSDADLKLQSNPAELDGATIAHIKTHIHQLLNQDDDDAFSHWLGTVLSQHHQECEPPLEATDAQTLYNDIQAGRQLCLSPQTRLLFIDQSESMRVFINADCYELTGDFDHQRVRHICHKRSVDADDLPASAKEPLVAFLCAAYNHGAWLFSDELYADCCDDCDDCDDCND